MTIGDLMLTRQASRRKQHATRARTLSKPASTDVRGLRRAPDRGLVRRGLTLIEIAVSVAVLGVGLTTAVEVIQWSAAEHRAAEKKCCAVEAATTVLDRLTVAEWSTVTQE